MHPIDTSQPFFCKDISVFFLISFVLLTPLVSVIYAQDLWVSAFFYLALTVSCLASVFPFRKNDYLINFIALMILFFFAMSGNLVKGVGVTLVFFSVYNSARNSLLVIIHTLFILLAVNYLMLLLQLSGVSEFAYSFTNYAGELNVPYSFLKFDPVPAKYLPQFRPSGIFPSPTYVSFFCIILYAMASFYHVKISKFFMVVMGSSFMLVGSTMGLMLILLIALNIILSKKFIWAFMSYVATFICYYFLFPSFVEYNFSRDDLLASLLNREMAESILSTNPSLLVLLTLGFSLIFLNINNVSSDRLIRLLPITILIFLPILLHDASYSILNFLIFGLGFGMLNTLIADYESFKGIH